MTTAIVGAGLAGLVLGYRLRQRGASVVVLEGAGAAGGAIRSERMNGYLCEAGPHAFVDRHEGFRALLDELGLSHEVVRANPDATARYVVCRGKLEALPEKPPHALRTPLLSTAGKLRALAEPLFARRNTSGDDESLQDFMARHVGAQATAQLFDAMQTGIYAGRMDELSAQATFPKLVALEQAHRSLLLGMLRARKEPRAPRGVLSSLSGGLGALTDALARSLDDALKLDAKVTGLSRKGERWAVQTQEGQLDADRVVLATHPVISGALLAPVDATLGEALSSMPHAPMAVVHLGLPRDRVTHSLRGFGFLAPAVENRKVLGCIFASATFPERAPEGQVLLTALVGGRRSPDQVALHDRALIAAVRDELRTLLGADGQPELVSVSRHPLGIPQYVVGHRGRTQTIEGRRAGLPGLHLCGWGQGGVGVLDVVETSTNLAAKLCEEGA